MLDENAIAWLASLTIPLGGEISVVCGGVNSPHGPGAAPSMRHSPPAVTLVAYGCPQASSPNELSPKPTPIPSSRMTGGAAFRFVVSSSPLRLGGPVAQK